MEPDQKQRKSIDTSKVYPTPTKGPVSDDHSGYQKPVQWAGTDPDKNNKLYLIIFIIILGLMFVFAVHAWTGVNLLKLP